MKNQLEYPIQCQDKTSELLSDYKTLCIMTYRNNEEGS